MIGLLLITLYVLVLTNTSGLKFGGQQMVEERTFVAVDRTDCMFCTLSEFYVLGLYYLHYSQLLSDLENNPKQFSPNSSNSRLEGE